VISLSKLKFAKQVHAPLARIFHRVNRVSLTPWL
jgi:hypothetical protein